MSWDEREHRASNDVRETGVRREAEVKVRGRNEKAEVKSERQEGEESNRSEKEKAEVKS